MADPLNTKATDALATIIKQTTDLQHFASRVGHLALAIRHASDHVLSPRLEDHECRALHGMTAFADIVGELAVKIADAGENIEVAANQARRA